ncbi:MAG: acyltransferase [Cyclobacteriaceae bacterium]|nr:acyltransferase [Cyclobacteriaceae bacterium]
MRENSIGQLLSRKTSGNFFLPEIDGFRFFAIATVLLYHLNTHLSRVFYGSSDFSNSILHKIISRGSVGVDVFFAISGFILALPFAHQHLFAKQPISLKSYYLRRITRLEPPYVISLIVFLLVHVILLKFAWGEVLPHFLASLFYIHSIVYDSWSTINPVTWSLEVEVQFYLLAPFLAACFRITDVVWRRGLLIGVILISILHYNLNYEMIETLNLRKSIFMHLHQFLIGFLFADFFLTDWNEILKNRSYRFDIVGVSSLTGLLIFNAPFHVLDDLVFSVCLFLSLVCLFKGRLINTFFTQRWVVIIGGMCYSIYLLHYALIAFLATHTKIWFFTEWSYAANFGLQFLVIVPVVLGVSAIFFAVIERPCMDKDWPSQLYNRLKTIFT